MHKKVNIINNEAINYVVDGNSIIDINLEDILAVGELTSTDGPFMDDHHIVLISAGMWHSIAADAIGINQLVRLLERHFNSDFDFQLSNITEFKSRLVFPDELRGKEFVRMEDVSPSGLVDKLKIKLGLKPGFQIVLHDDIQSLLKN